MLLRFTLVCTRAGTDVSRTMLTTRLEPRAQFLNTSELPVRVAAYSTRSGTLLTIDNNCVRLHAGTREIKCMPLPQTTHGSHVQQLHYNQRENHFIAVYASREARVVDMNLVMHEAGAVNTEQLTILSSVWLEQRQELVTSGGDGSLRFFCLKRQHAVTLTGRRLLSRLIPRMTVRMQVSQQQGCAL